MRASKDWHGRCRRPSCSIAHGLGIVLITAWILPGQAQAPTADDNYLDRLRVGREQASQGNIALGEADIRAAIASDPGQAAGWYELGSVLGQEGEFREAEAALRRAIQLQPGLAKAHYSLALTLIGNPKDKLDWPAAMAECREALHYQPDYPEAENLLGAGLLNTGQIDEAIATLQRVVKLAPGLAEAHFNLALALEGRDRLDEAAAELKAAKAARGAYPEAASALGQLYFRQNKTVEAERELDAALRLNPDLTDAHYALARVLRSIGRGEEATEEFAQAKELMARQPNGVQSSQLSNEALALAAKGDLKGAAELLRKAISLKPDYAVPHYNLGLILADSGDLRGARQELSKAISLMPAQAKMWFDLGRVLRLSKDDEMALQAMLWAAHLAPSDRAIQAEIATLREALPGAAAKSATAAITQPPNVGALSETSAAHFEFAIRLVSEKDLLGSVGELLRSLALEPARVEARRRLAQSYTSLGQADLAAVEYEKVLHCVPEDGPSHLALGKWMLAEDATEGAVRHLRLAVAYDPGSAEARAKLGEAEKRSSGH